MALGDGEPQSAEERLKDAELAMYHAKRNGGDRIDVFKPAMRARKTDRLTIAADLRRAIEREEINILYQPIVRLEDRVVAGFEALARWNHPKLGRMSPQEFIKTAEESGLIVELGLFILERTAQATEHLAANAAPARAVVRQCQCLIASIAASRSDAGSAHGPGARSGQPRDAET